MGCLLSKLRTEPPSGFKVYNLDCNGNVKNEGHLEITSSDLVLHFKGNKPPAVWPLSSVRKYGYEELMFCFEAGRSSPCGQGVFAFKSKKAQQIFDSLKEELSKIDNNPNKAEDISLEIQQYSGEVSSSTNDVFENLGEVKFCGLKSSESNENIHSPDLIEPDNVLPAQEPLTNGKKLINAGIFASPYYQFPAEVLTYTQVEISVCPLKKIDPLPSNPIEQSDYKVIDFVQTMNISQKMLKSSGDVGGRKTRHDSTLENA